MLLSIVVSVVAFSAAASATFSPLENMLLSIFARFHPKKDKDLFLHERIRKIKFVKLAGLTVEIVAFIMLGTCASQLSIYLYDPPPEEGANWTWMTSFYWAVQTATTIGYGVRLQCANFVKRVLLERRAKTAHNSRSDSKLLGANFLCYVSHFLFCFVGCCSR